MKKQTYIGLLFVAMFIFSFTLTYSFSVKSMLNKVSVDLVKSKVLAENKGTLYGNKQGTLFCCDDGTNDCSAAPCKHNQE